LMQRSVLTKSCSVNFLMISRDTAISCKLIVSGSLKSPNITSSPKMKCMDSSCTFKKMRNLLSKAVNRMWLGNSIYLLSTSLVNSSRKILSLKISITSHLYSSHTNPNSNRLRLKNLKSRPPRLRRLNRYQEVPQF
jgi:hypothetical protein